MLCVTHSVQLHARALEGGFQGLGKRILAQGQQHVGRHTTGAGAGYGLVGTLATGKSLEVPPQHRLTGRGNMVGPDHKVQIGGTGYQNHGVTPCMKRCIVPSNPAMPMNEREPSVPAYVALIGGANLDISAHSHAKPLMGDSNPGRIHCSPGGVARNVAENLVRLGQDARLLSVLGDDAFAAVLRQAAAGVGLDLSACATLAGQRTATYLSLHAVDRDMGVAVNDMGILEQMTPALLAPHAQTVRQAAAVVVDCNVRPDVLQWLCTELAHPVVFAEAVSVAKCQRLLPVLHRLHTLKANGMEAQSLSGIAVDDIPSARAAALALRQRGVGRVVISLGARGVVWCDSDGSTGHRAAQPVQMVSATGAGDALLSGLVHGHLQRMAMDLGVMFAMACAELTLSSTFANSPELCVAAVRTHLQQQTT